MGERFRMTAKTVFHNARMEPATVTVGDEFETDAVHAQDLARLGMAEPEDREALSKAEPEVEVQSPPAIASNRTSTTKKLA